MRRFTFDRSFYIPKGSRKITSKASAAVVYVHEGKTAAGRDAFYAVAFAGKAAKPVFNYRYTSAANRENSVRSFFEGQGKRAAMRQDWKDEAKARTEKAVAERKVGDVYVEVTSYSMTFNTFYQVVGLVGKTSVRVRKIASINMEDHGHYQGTEIPSIDSFVEGSEVLTKRIVEGRIAIGTRGAGRWDGQPCRYNHMD